MKRYQARDGAVTGAICGLAGAAWFGWADQSPPAGWSIPLSGAAVASLVLMVACGLLVVRHRHGPTAMADPGVRRRYLLIVAVEVVACVVGAVVLGRAGQQVYLPAWILFVVGAHFLPLARLFGNRDLLLSGPVLMLVAAVAGGLGAAHVALPSTVAGAGGGVVLSICAGLNLRRGYLAPVDAAVVSCAG